MTARPVMMGIACYGEKVKKRVPAGDYHDCEVDGCPCSCHGRAFASQRDESVRAAIASGRP